MCHIKSASKNDLNTFVIDDVIENWKVFESLQCLCIITIVFLEYGLVYIRHINCCFDYHMALDWPYANC